MIKKLKRIIKVLLLVLCLTAQIFDTGPSWVKDRFDEIERYISLGKYERWVENLSSDYRLFIESEKCLKDAEKDLEETTGLRTKITHPEEYFMYFLGFMRMDGRMLYVSSERLSDNIILVHYRQQGSSKEYGCKFVLEEGTWKFDGRGMEE